MEEKVCERASCVAVAGIVGSVVALLESMWLMLRSAQPMDLAVAVILYSYLGYIGCSVAVTLIWSLLRARSRRYDSQEARATAICIPAGIFIGATALTFIGAMVAGPLISALLVLLAMLLLAILYHLLRAFIMRHRIIGSAQGWLLVHAVALSMSIALLAIKYSGSGWAWLNVPLALIMLGCIAGVRFLSAGRNRTSLMAAINVIAIAALALLPLWPQGDGKVLAREQQRPNILLITVDTLRADHLGCYGYDRARTPNIDRMAREGVLFSETIAPAPLTGPSHASILTGLYPLQHGALHNASHLNDDVSTLPEVLARQGYHTAAFVSGWTLKDEAVGLADRFHVYDDQFGTLIRMPEIALKLKLFDLAAALADEAGIHIQRIERRASGTTDAALQALRRNRHKPFFLWVHYFDPHIPYAPPPPYDKIHDPNYRGDANGKWYYEVSIAQKEKTVQSRRDLEHMIALYDGEISYVDAEIGRLRSALAELGLDNNTLIILTADHGESLGEHNLYFEHSNYLYDSLLRVPLILIFPDGSRSGQRISGQTRLIDIAPTIVDILEIATDIRFEGKSLMPLISGRETNGRPAFAAVPPGAWSSGRSIYAVRDKGYKLIWTSSEWNYLGLRIPPREELYDLRADPQERNNLLADGRPVLAELRQALAAWRGQESSRQTPLSKEVREKLRSLGYLQ